MNNNDAENIDNNIDTDYTDDTVGNDFDYSDTSVDTEDDHELESLWLQFYKAYIVCNAKK